MHMAEYLLVCTHCSIREPTHCKSNGQPASVPWMCVGFLLVSRAVLTCSRLAQLPEDFFFEFFPLEYGQGADGAATDQNVGDDGTGFLARDDFPMGFGLDGPYTAVPPPTYERQVLPTDLRHIPMLPPHTLAGFGHAPLPVPAPAPFAARAPLHRSFSDSADLDRAKTLSKVLHTAGKGHSMCLVARRFRASRADTESLRPCRRPLWRRCLGRAPIFWKAGVH